MRALRLILACALALTWACGDDSGTADTGTTDTGTTDTGTTDTGTGDGGDAMVETVTLNLRYVDPDENPLADVKSAIDANGMRVETISGADGIVRIPIPARIGDTISGISALEGYTILSRVDTPLEDVGVGEGAEPIDVTLFPLAPPLGSRENFTIVATGVPAGGWICASHGAGENQNFTLCADPDTTWRFMIPVRAIGDGVNVWAIDDTGAPIDFERVPIAAAERSVTVDFDGAFATAPEMRTVRLDFPDDPESPINTAMELPTGWPGWFGTADRTTGQQWSFASVPTRDAGDLVTQVFLVTPPAGVELRYGAGAWAQLRSLHSVQFATFMSDPGTTAPMLGFPKITDGNPISGPFTVDAPAQIGTDELLNVLTFRNSGSRNVWQVISPSTTIQAPELPSMYDTEVSFPFPGASGTAIVQTVTRLEFEEMAGVERDFYNSASAEVPISF